MERRAKPSVEATPQRRKTPLTRRPSRLAWGDRNEGRFTVEAGKTYLLVLAERYGPNRSYVGGSWTPFDSQNVKKFVSEKKLEYVTSADEALAELRAEGLKKFENAKE